MIEVVHSLCKPLLPGVGASAGTGRDVAAVDSVYAARGLHGKRCVEEGQGHVGIDHLALQQVAREVLARRQAARSLEGQGSASACFTPTRACRKARFGFTVKDSS